ncbi:MAG: 30S ribosomal protein S11 [Verrucomicrobia bacterium]|nr:MAG: 30S ribosomal protein S11 [Verrucomicrobiota bacterium]
MSEKNEIEDIVSKESGKVITKEKAMQKETDLNNAVEEVEPKKAEQPTAADLLKADIGEVKIRRAKGSKNIATGICNILATFNNTKVTFADANGNVISWSSAGKCNFRGSRKSTAYSAQIVTQDAGRVAISHGLKEVYVFVKGPGLGRDAAIRTLQALGLVITGLKDITPVPHNGCRAPQRRRV